MTTQLEVSASSLLKRDLVQGNHERREKIFELKLHGLCGNTGEYNYVVLEFELYAYFIFKS